jgi:hypothetical protein
MVLRPFEASTLQEGLEKGTFGGPSTLLNLVRKLIILVSELNRRGMAHGHISPSNVTVSQDELILLDPIIGVLHQTNDVFLAPECGPGRMPEKSADVYSLGRMIKILLGGSLTERQAALVEQLLLATPGQRPPLVEVAVAFGVEGVTSPHDRERVTTRGGGSGKLVRQGGAPPPPPAPPSAAPVQEEQAPEPQTPPKQSSFGNVLLVAGALLVAGGWYAKTRNPALYYQVAQFIPFLAPEHSAEYAAAWASGERSRMAVVARAALLRKEPAAINTIVEDLMSGSNPDGVKAALLRVALSDTWRNDLSARDTHAALALALSQLVPEGLSQIEPLDSLHPGILLAMLGTRQGPDPSKVLAGVPVSVLSNLPEPFGPLFGQLEGMGVKTLNDARAKGLARIVTGDASAEALELYIGEEQDQSKVLAAVSTVLPVVAANPVAQKDLLGVLQDRGGDIATLCGWFEILDLAGWSRVPVVDKIRLILALEPESKLDPAQWADLLSFPLESVRGFAIKSLRSSFAGPDGEKLLLTLASPTVGLQREQIISLISALKLSGDKQPPFVSAWFNLKPSADAVLLLLVARSSADSSDVFNLEAARYLRRASWTAPLDLLQLLAQHQEPLARAIAYGKLDPGKEAERALLQARKEQEKDASCVKVIEEKLRGY